MATSSRSKKPARRSASGRTTRAPGLAIDMHAHMVNPETAEFARKGLIPTGAAKDRRLDKRTRARLARERALIERRMIDVKQRLRDMDKMGVDIQVLTGSPVHQNTYWAAPTKSAKMEAASNDAIAEMIAKYPDRFVGLGSVPLQDTKLAVKELSRCMNRLGFKGVQVSSTAGKGIELGDKKLRPFWARAEKLGAVVYIHPAGMTEPRHQMFALWNSIGQLYEEAMAQASLFYEGIMDAYPDLKVCIAHGGGFSPYYTGRLDRNYLEKPDTAFNMSKSPSEYMRQFYYESCVYNRDTLENLVQKVGAGRVMMGSDYPVGEADPIGFVRGSRKISAADKDRILWKTAAGVLNISV